MLWQAGGCCAFTSLHNSPESICAELKTRNPANYNIFNVSNSQIYAPPTKSDTLMSAGPSNSSLRVLTSIPGIVSHLVLTNCFTIVAQLMHHLWPHWDRSSSASGTRPRVNHLNNSAINLRSIPNRVASIKSSSTRTLSIRGWKWSYNHKTWLAPEFRTRVEPKRFEGVTWAAVGHISPRLSSTAFITSTLTNRNNFHIKDSKTTLLCWQGFGSSETSTKTGFCIKLR